MRNFPALVVIIILIASLIIVVGFIIASITHKYSAEKDLQTEIAAPGDELLELDQKIFALQLFSSDKLSKTEHQKQKLENAGFKTKIMKSLKDGNTEYNLQLEGLYGEKEATTLGEEIKRKVPSIQTYWLDQISGDAGTEPVTEQDKSNRIQQFLKQPEKTTELTENGTSIDDLRYEIQIMASGNYARIEEVKETLASLGYKTKILTLNQSNQIVYRLRLKGSYTEKEAIQMGEKLVKESPLVSNYWLDEIVEDKTIPRKTQVTQIQQRKTLVDTGNKDYEIQILANTDLAKVREYKRILDRNGYPAKITTAVVKGTTYYRLRLEKSYSKTGAADVGKNLVKKINFIKDYWVVKKTPGEKRVTDNQHSTQNKQVVPKTETREEPDRSQNPEYKNTTVDYSATCNRNSINIRTGPGTHYTIDPIGKLMRGITIFVVEEKDGWARFTITPNDESWSGWVKLEYIDKN